MIIVSTVLLAVKTEIIFRNILGPIDFVPQFISIIK